MKLKLRHVNIILIVAVRGLARGRCGAASPSVLGRTLPQTAGVAVGGPVWTSVRCWFAAVNSHLGCCCDLVDQVTGYQVNKYFNLLILIIY